MKNYLLYFSLLLIPLITNAQEFKITPDDIQPGKWFGSSVSINGEYALVGATLDNTNGYGAGAVYFFKKEGNAWTQQAKFIPDDIKTNDYLGAVVSVSGNNALAGADGQDPAGYNSGAVYAFTLKNGEWKLTLKIFPEDNQAIDFFGAFLDVYHDYAIISSRGDDDAGENMGSVYIFHLEDSIWVQQAKFTPNSATSRDYSYGQALALNDEYAVAGSHKDFTAHFFQSGTAYVYRRIGEIWVFDSQLLPKEPYERASFGAAVAIDGNRILVGAPGAIVDGVATGAAYLFTRIDSQWVQTAVLTVPGAKGTDYIGFQVSLSGRNAFLNNSEQEGFIESGEVYWFQERNGNWAFQQTIKASDNISYNRYCFRGLEFSGNHLIVSAITDRANGEKESGAAYIYDICQLLPEDFDILINGSIPAYPNPSSGLMTLDLPDDCIKAEAILFDSKGALVGQFPVFDKTLDLSQLPSAIYFAKIITPQHHYSLKIIKI